QSLWHRPAARVAVVKVAVQLSDKPRNAITIVVAQRCPAHILVTGMVVILTPASEAETGFGFTVRVGVLLLEAVPNGDASGAAQEMLPEYIYPPPSRRPVVIVCCIDVQLD